MSLDQTYDSTVTQKIVIMQKIVITKVQSAIITLSPRKYDLKLTGLLRLGRPKPHSTVPYASKSPLDFSNFHPWI